MTTPQYGEGEAEVAGIAPTKQVNYIGDGRSDNHQDCEEFGELPEESA
jgi:hypothetical protein